MGYTRNELQGISWYHLLHWDSMREAQNKHRLSKFFIVFIENFFLVLEELTKTSIKMAIINYNSFNK